MGISFNSYMCGEYFWRLVDVISNVKCVSTHICAGNVSVRCIYDRHIRIVSTHICAGNVSASPAFPFGAIDVSTYICAGNVSGRRSCFGGATAGGFNSYMCGECFTFQTPLALPGFRFNSYMCGECFMPFSTLVSCCPVSTHICAGNVSYNSRRLGQSHRCFNSYMRGECFDMWDDLLLVDLEFQLIYARGMFQNLLRHIISRLGFQLIYARGMFQGHEVPGVGRGDVSTHICAGNVSAFMRGFAILDGANPQEFDCSQRVRAVIYRMR